MKLTRVNRGQPILPEMRADTWNAFIDAAVAHRMRAGGQPLDVKPTIRRMSASALVFNDSGTDCEAGDVLGIDGMMIGPADNLRGFRNQPILQGVAPAADHLGKFAICEEVIPDQGIGWAVVAGLAFTRLDDPSKPWRRADIDAGDQTRLAMAPNGTAAVMWSVAGGEEVGGLTTQDGDRLITQGGDSLTDGENYGWALVQVGVPETISYPGVADSTISVDSSGVVSIWVDGEDSGEDVTAHLDWMHGDEQISADKQVIVTWFPLDAKWRITAAECED